MPDSNTNMDHNNNQPAAPNSDPWTPLEGWPSIPQSCADGKVMAACIQCELDGPPTKLWHELDPPPNAPLLAHTKDGKVIQKCDCEKKCTETPCEAYQRGYKDGMEISLKVFRLGIEHGAKGLNTSSAR